MKSNGGEELEILYVNYLESMMKCRSDGIVDCFFEEISRPSYSQCVKEIVEGYPHRAKLEHFLTYLKYSEKDRKSRFSTLLKCHEFYPEEMNVNFKLGSAYYEEYLVHMEEIRDDEDIDTSTLNLAIEHITMEISLFPENNISRNFYERGIVFDLLENYESCLGDFTIALEHETNRSDRIRIYQMLGETKIELRKYEEALEDFIMCISEAKDINCKHDFNMVYEVYREVILSLSDIKRFIMNLEDQQPKQAFRKLGVIENVLNLFSDIEDHAEVEKDTDFMELSLCYEEIQGFRKKLEEIEGEKTKIFERIDLPLVLRFRRCDESRMDDLERLTNLLESRETQCCVVRFRSICENRRILIPRFFFELFGV